MKVSISIDVELWKRFRIVALEQGLTASALLASVLQAYLKGKVKLVVAFGLLALLLVGAKAEAHHCDRMDIDCKYEKWFGERERPKLPDYDFYNDPSCLFGCPRRQEEVARQRQLNEWFRNCNGVKLRDNLYERCVERAKEWKLITEQDYREERARIERFRASERERQEFEAKVSQLDAYCRTLGETPEDHVACYTKAEALGLLNERGKAELERQRRCLALPPNQRLLTVGCKVQ